MRCVALLCLLGASAVAAQPAPASAPSIEARAAFTTGVARMQKAQWEQALSEFQRSIELQPTQVALFNAAMCLKNLGRHDEALGVLERLLREFGDQATEVRRAEYRAELEDLRAHLAQVVVATDVDGADVRVDGVSIGVSPLRVPVFLLPGEHVVEASRVGSERARVHITVAARELRSIRLRLQPPPSPAEASPPAVPPPAPRVHRGPSTTWFWLAAGTAAVATLATGVLGTLALTGNSAYESDAQRTQAEQDAGKRLVLGTDIALGVAVASGLTAGILWSVTDFGAGTDEARTSRAPRLGVALAPERAALTLSGDL